MFFKHDKSPSKPVLGEISASSSPIDARDVRPKTPKRISENISSIAKAAVSGDTDRLITQLQNELKIKESMIASMSNKIERLEDETRNLPFNNVLKRQHPISTVTHQINDKGAVAHAKIGTRGSIMTENVLQAIAEAITTKSPTQLIAEKFVHVFQNPLEVENMSYMQSSKFSTDLMTLCMDLEIMLESEPRCLFLQSPVRPCAIFCDASSIIRALYIITSSISLSPLHISLAGHETVSRIFNIHLTCTIILTSRTVI